MLAYPDTCFKRKLLCVCVCLYYASCRFYLFEFILGESGGGLGKFYPLASSVSGRVVTARRHIRCQSDECFRSLRAFLALEKEKVVCFTKKKTEALLLNRRHSILFFLLIFVAEFCILFYKRHDHHGSKTNGDPLVYIYTAYDSTWTPFGRQICIRMGTHRCVSPGVMQIGNPKAPKDATWPVGIQSKTRHTTRTNTDTRDHILLRGTNIYIYIDDQ